MMRLRVALIVLALASPAAAQSVDTSAGVPLTLAEAEKRALDRNPQLAEVRLGTEGADYAIAEARAAYAPSFSASLVQQSRGQTSTTTLGTDASALSTGLAQLLPWGGGRVSLDFTGTRTAQSTLLDTSPSTASNVAATITQPLLRGFSFDTTRATIAQADISRRIADISLRQEAAVLLADVRRAYWELVYTVDALETARRSESLAVQARDDNQRRVELGTVAPLDVLESEAEVASRHQATVQAEGAWRDAQIALKQLIVANAGDEMWNATVVPSDRPASDIRTIDVNAAVTSALANRTDLARSRQQRTANDISLKLTADERKPGLDLVGGYSFAGNYANALQSIGAVSTPSWSVGLSVSLPIGNRAANARYAQAQVAQKQATSQIQSLELQATAAVTRAAQQVRSAEEQVKAAEAARTLAQRRLEAEQARRDVGLSTTFLVLQAQRDLTTAVTNHLRAQLDYRTALVTFDLAQEAPAA